MISNEKISAAVVVKKNYDSIEKYVEKFKELLSKERKNLRQGKVALNKNHRERSTIDVPQKK